ncbi:MAG: tetratricopeptide repeat protein [Spirochaetales bacterium]|nr:tetratricopeptide repeat protein [Spirochaetales bacterium]
MGTYNVIIVIGITILAVAIVFALFFQRNLSSDSSKRKPKKKIKDRNKIIKMANKKLMINPKDPDALLALADLYFREGVYDKAARNYQILLNMCAANPDLNEFEITLNYGLSQVKLKNLEEAYKSFVLASTMGHEHFDLNFNLGYMEYLRKNYEKSALLLAKAREDQPDHVQTIRFLGLSLFKIKKYPEAILCLDKAIEYEPDDKEALFNLAECLYETGKHDKALLIFSHLRTDATLGPQAALVAGTINLNLKQYSKAVMDLEIGLRHESIPREVGLELKYRLANVYFKSMEIDKALKLIKEIYSIAPDYKDVSEQIKKYEELSLNKNLQVYLISPASEFITLCRRIAINFFPKARCKIIDITIVKNSYTDILAEVNTKKWEDLILFRFIRSTGTIGELILRELYSRCKDLKAGRGFCISAGNYTEGAKQFVEARLIDLIEKEALLKIFNKFALNSDI